MERQIVGDTARPSRLKVSRATMWLFLAVLAVVSLVTSPAAALAQTPGGRIVGQVVDAESGRPLIGATIAVEGTTRGTLSGVDGRYVLTAPSEGPLTLAVSYLGYSSKRVTDIEVARSGGLSLDIALTPSAVELEGITVSVGSELGTIGRALDEQRTAVGVTSAITAEQISRSSDGDAAAAVQRVSGVTVQGGRYVFVRGLGERYTTTSLNGSRIPSPEPERRMVPLDLFPTGLLQSITTAKTFTPNLSGDFSGAQVDIQTREFPASRQTSYSYSLGYNPGVTGSVIPSAPGAGGEWLAYATAPRRMPQLLQSDGARDHNAVVRSFRNSWSVDQKTALPATSMAVSVGGTDPLFGHDLGYLASLTYSLSQESQIDHVRAVATPEGERSRYEGRLGRTSVLWGSLVNLSSMIGSGTRLVFNGSYNRSSDNDARRERGIDENTGSDFRVDRLQYVERAVASAQMRGEHQLNPGNRLDWALSASSVTRQEPDRSEIVYQIERSPDGEELPPAWAPSGNEMAVRTFAELDERAFESRVNYRLSFGTPSRPLDLIVGGLGRFTDRSSDNRAWSIQSLNRNPLTQDRALREQAPEVIFGDAFTNPGDDVFTVISIAQGGSYSAKDYLGAGYAMVEWTPVDRIQLVAGARVEHSRLDLEAIATDRRRYSAAPTYTDVLPSLAVNFAASPEQNIRFSASQTLARPEYREVAPIQYREVIGGENTRGNAELRRTLIQNVDLRWEYYPGADELLSVALFAKRFQDPIERIYLATSGTPLNTFVNAAGAENYGVEIEARKGLGALGPTLEPLTLFSNLTMMKSEIRIGNDGLASTTNPERPMIGQAPYVLNAGLTYARPDLGAAGTILYNRVGRRIVAAAGFPLPDVYEMPRPSLDLSFQFPLPGSLSGKIDAKNLLDSPHLVQQGDVTREYYRTGRTFSVGVSLRR